MKILVAPCCTHSISPYLAQYMAMPLDKRAAAMEEAFDAQTQERLQKGG